jgi:hypothetical protein
MPTVALDDLRLERRDQENETQTIHGGGGVIEFAPLVDEDYWAYRVVLSDKQAIVGFPKFGTIGVGFAVEEDWNTNLPFTVPTDAIFEHIEHNKGDESVSDEAVKRAIQMVREAASADLERPLMTEDEYDETPTGRYRKAQKEKGQ